MKEIPLTKGKVALVDDEDYERVAKYRWCAVLKKNGKWYAYSSSRRGGVNRKILLHRFILSAAPDIQVDHKNSDGLNCQRGNIRFATDAQNRYNKVGYGISGLKGVAREKGGRWRATITRNHRIYRLGSFRSGVEAAQAYDAKARELFGEFAWLNFPSAGESGQTWQD